MRFYCTYFDENYLTRGLALYRSLRRHSGPFRLWVLCLSKTCHSALARLELPDIELIPLAEFERDDVALTEARSNRSLIEYYFTCTPSLPRFVFQQFPAVDRVTYLDSDLFFFNDPELVHNEIGDHSIAVIPHGFPPALVKLTRHGIYNVGWITFQRDQVGIACLEWWRERCLEWCYDRCESSRFADQKYLDDWPSRFRNVKVLDHPGMNLALWNVANRSLGMDRHRVRVDGRPLVFYHFHGLKQVDTEVYDPGFRRYQVLPDPILCRYIYAPYLRELRRAGRAAPDLNSSPLPRRELEFSADAPPQVRHLLPEGMVELEDPELPALRKELESTLKALKAHEEGLRWQRAAGLDGDAANLQQEFQRLTRGVHYWIPPALTIALRKVERRVRRLRRRISGSA